jgi:hypothetical protein
VTGLLAYVASAVAFAALLCGHHGQDWPLAGVWGWLYARLSAPQPSDTAREPRTAPRPAQGRPAPSWATQQPIDYEEAA